MKYLVFDIGGTFIKYGIISSEYEVIYNYKFPTPSTLEEFLSNIKKIYLVYANEVEGVAISMPGHIDEYSGFAFSAGVITYLAQTNIVSLLHEFIDKPISVENDGKCAALAEVWIGSLKGVNHGIVLVFGTGVGGGIVIDKKLYKGFNGIAGEFSFISEKISEDRNDFLGRIGSVTTLIEYVAKMKNMSTNDLNGEKVFTMINNRDEKAVKGLEKFCDDIVRHVYNLQHILDPELFSIGGGISVQKAFIDCLNNRIDAYANNKNIVLKKPKIVQSTYNNNANMLGALINYHINNVKKVG